MNYFTLQYKDREEEKKRLFLLVKNTLQSPLSIEISQLNDSLLS